MKKKLIILIENDLKLIKEMTEFLGKNGFRVKQVINPMDALKHIKREKPDLIVMNVIFSDINGFKLCDDIKKDKRLKIIPIILMIDFSDTISSNGGLDERGQKILANDFITKPFEMDKLLEIIEDNINN